MNTREQFGDYLLLKKLTEDPLGETYRAGQLGAKGMESVVLLRVLNGQAVDGRKLWGTIRKRAALHDTLKSPNIGESVATGEIQGIPYVAYEYVSGKNLSNLFEQAARKKNPIPVEHGLLITERVALALAAAREYRIEGERVIHGFLVPNLVMISNEGEARLLGLELGPGLRESTSNPLIRQHFGRYLSPEALSGAAPDRADDIYSLGVLLFELLTGTTLPPPISGSYKPVIDGATLAQDGQPLPADIAQLLKESLVPQDQRMREVNAWHKALNRSMFEGAYNPTTFNLAFYMHNLFRQDIERESQEIEVEKTLSVPVIATTTPAA
ncbi:MAG: protein kinase, partial [Acidobacteriota bacterium]